MMEERKEERKKGRTMHFPYHKKSKVSKNLDNIVYLSVLRGFF